jgi:hypothetical protein
MCSEKVLRISSRNSRNGFTISSHSKGSMVILKNIQPGRGSMNLIPLVSTLKGLPTENNSGDREIEEEELGNREIGEQGK